MSAWGKSWGDTWGNAWGVVSSVVSALGGGKKREEELWKNLPDIVQWKPKEKVEEVVSIPQVFLPARESVSPEEIASIAKEIAKKIHVAKKVIITPTEDDDEEALFLLGIL